MTVTAMNNIDLRARPAVRLVSGVPLDALTVDPTYQRDLDDPFVRRTAKRYDRLALGVVSVAERADGTLVILDGMHRTAFAKLAGETGIDCRIISGLSLEEEAALFVKLNLDKPMSLFSKHKAMSLYDPEAQDINMIAGKLGLRIAERKGAVRGEIYAIDAVRSVYRNLGPECLEWVLWVLHTAWDGALGSYQRPLVNAVANLVRVHGEAVDADRLARQMAKAAQTPQDMVGLFSDQHKTFVGKVSNRHLDVAGRIVLEHVYNAGRRKGNLPTG